MDDKFLNEENQDLETSELGVVKRPAEYENVDIKVGGKPKLTGGDIVFYILDYAFYIIFTLSCIFPFYYLFINTISDVDLVNKGAINFIPKGINFSNYKSVFGLKDLSNALWVTVARTILGTALMVVASGFVGYLVTKKEMWHRQFFYRFLLITMYFNAGLIPWYLNMNMLGLTNHFSAYIIPGIVAPYNIILVKTYIESIPAELEESAFIDGASFFTVFRKIIWPLSKPILATIAIFGAVGHWNSFQDSLILMQGAPKYKTLQHLLYEYMTRTTNVSQSISASDPSAANKLAQNNLVVKYTISMVTIIPILLVYPFMQRYFEEGIMLGAVKG
ncbi:MAG: carbohydrate ABC transporter permease [Lachnospiraceae bacterium]|nr:carbohydrate ABC transporter permease [Lachnospiraceae bacterium]